MSNPTLKFLDLIHKKFGEDMIIEIYSDDSSRIYHKQTTRLDEYL